MDIYIYISVYMIVIYGTRIKAQDYQSPFTAQNIEIFIHKNQFLSGSIYTDHVYQNLLCLECLNSVIGSISTDHRVFECHLPRRDILQCM